MMTGHISGGRFLTVIPRAAVRTPLHVPLITKRHRILHGRMPELPLVPVRHLPSAEETSPRRHPMTSNIL